MTALVVAPGVARAAGGGTDQLGAATDSLADVPNPLDPGAGGEEVTPAPPAFEVPPELEAAFRQFATQAGISQQCVTDVTAALEQIGTGLTTPPMPPEEVVAEIQGLLTGLGTNPSPEALAGFGEDVGALLDPQNNDVALGLQALATALSSEECRPAPPEAPAPPPAPAKPVGGPVQQPAAPAPYVPAPAPPKGVYLGYAPTGASAPAADDPTVPMAAFGGGLVLLAGAGATGYGMRRRAVRPRN